MGASTIKEMCATIMKMLRFKTAKYTILQEQQDKIHATNALTLTITIAVAINACPVTNSNHPPTSWKDAEHAPKILPTSVHLVSQDTVLTVMTNAC